MASTRGGGPLSGSRREQSATECGSNPIACSNQACSAAHQAKPLFIGLPETPFMSSDGVLSFLPHDRPVETHFMCSSLLNDCPSVSLISHTGF